MARPTNEMDAKLALVRDHREASGIELVEEGELRLAPLRSSTQQASGKPFELRSWGSSTNNETSLCLLGDGTGGTHCTEPTNSSSASASGSEVKMSAGLEQEQDESDAVGSEDNGDEEDGGGEMQSDEDQRRPPTLPLDGSSSSPFPKTLQRPQDALRRLARFLFQQQRQQLLQTTPLNPNFPPSSPTSNPNTPPQPSSMLLLFPQTNLARTPNRARRHTTSFPGAPLSAISVISLPGYPSLFNAGPLPSNTPPGRAARTVWIKFNAHLDALMEAVRNLRFDVFELS
ncbi:hypothetical protein BDY24DRAFT_416661 [Mrakia frigida]|uniref:uncharacterized protein n=1 Tax=Mrakia frigida TaxID=29902 RepID=UPI003FCC1530